MGRSKGIAKESLTVGTVLCPKEGLLDRTLYDLVKIVIVKHENDHFTLQYTDKDDVITLVSNFNYRSISDKFNLATMPSLVPSISPTTTANKIGTTGIIIIINSSSSNSNNSNNN